MMGRSRNKYGLIVATSICVLFVVVGLSACGGGDGNGDANRNGGGNGNGGSGFESGITDSKKLSEVTDSEAQSICDSVSSYQEGKVSKEKTVLWCQHATAKARLRNSEKDASELCSDAKSGCEEQSGGMSMGECSTENISGECEATVGEFETCVEDQINNYAQALNELPACSEVSEEWYQDWDQASLGDLPSSCQTVQEKCPSAFGSSGGTGGSNSSG